MNAATALPWHWQARQEPLPPRAAVAWGAAASRLHRRLQQMPEPQAARLLATAADQMLIASGGAADLPWVDGVAYAAPCPQAPGLWLPVLWQLDVPADLLACALQRRHPRQPLLLWPKPDALVPLDRLLPLNGEHLARIAALWQGRPA